MIERIGTFWAAWPPSLTHVLATVLTVAVAYLTGQVIRVAVVSRLARIAARTSGDTDDVLVSEIRGRIPFWSLLVGLYLSLAYWPLSAHGEQLAGQVLFALGVASVTLAVSAIGGRMVMSYGPRASVPVSGLAQNVVRIIVTVLGLLVILSSFNVSITPMLTALGVSGLALALALQDPLSNFFSGLSVSLAGNIRIGDYIRLETGAEGAVMDFNWRSTRLRQLAGNVIEVPNNKLAQAIVTNFSQPAPDLGIGVEVTVGFAANLDTVERLALEVARMVVADVPGAVLTAAPSVRFSAFTDTGVRFSVGMRVSGFVDQFLIKHEVIKRLHARMSEEGIKFAEVKK